MSTHFSALGFALLILATGSAVQAQPAPAKPASEMPDIRYIAANCANCHGTDGRSAGGGGMPGLAGLSPVYFREQMKLFREGKRHATIMHQISKGYTEVEIDALADYFASQQPAAAPQGGKS